ncbi:14325d16-b4e0-4eb4-bd11-0cf0dfbec65b [Thermothielavioides terrestris]|uniref:Uncharacterized protein n=2 Tax=Thermothielavioides terrestris TaxID=2587410 RepID=G2QVG0_THETT|nr:uncharacterized protein THITE_2086141 [Thermothielavioides terrestris NRRL 8126]AEO64650.1 hypothetical protein THITE_2086141 [Thermothielavioides terrestris NRRL 8126]SPQ26500.1 14325d16-b4e0-4eb4-bd11-0cf0dfbec65b [Thermothielavioides terrestris]
MRLIPSLALGLVLLGGSSASAVSTPSSSSHTGCGRKLYKLEIGTYKRDNVTRDQSPRRGVTRWTQILAPPSTRAIAAAIAAATTSSALPAPGWSDPQHDSVTAYYVADPAVLRCAGGGGGGCRGGVVRRAALRG